jgi:hypothetical protein
MSTIKATGPLLYAVQTDKMPGVPAGKVHVRMVRYETYEMDAADFDRTKFTVHDANTPEAKQLAECQKA